MPTELETAKILRILVSAYPNAKIIEGSNGTPGTLEVYATLLADVPSDELLAGVKYCIRNHPNFMPTVATILEAVRMMKPIRTVSGGDAWGVVLQAIREIGVYKMPHFEDAAIARAVEAFGWRNICLSDEQDFAIRAQFIKLYESYAQRVKEENELLRIPEAVKVMQEIAGRRAPLALQETK